MEFRRKAFLPSKVVETVHVAHPGVVEGGTFRHAIMSVDQLDCSEVKRRDSIRGFPKSLPTSKSIKREGTNIGKVQHLDYVQYDIIYVLMQPSKH